MEPAEDGRVREGTCEWQLYINDEFVEQALQVTIINKAENEQLQAELQAKHNELIIAFGTCTVSIEGVPPLICDLAS